VGGSRKSGGGGEVRGSWACGESGCGGFQDEAGQVEQEREGIAEQGGLGRIGEAEPGGSLQLVASLGGIAALGIGLSVDALTERLLMAAPESSQPTPAQPSLVASRAIYLLERNAGRSAIPVMKKPLHNRCVFSEKQLF